MVKTAGRKPSDKPTPGRFIDAATFMVGYTAYLQWVEENEGVHPQPSFAAKGKKIARRYLPMVENGMGEYIKPLTLRSDGGPLRTVYRKVEKGGSPEARIGNHAEVISRVLPWLKSRSAVMREVFTGKARKGASSLANAVEGASSPLGVLNALASVPSVSGLTAPRRWVEKAAEMAGVPISTTESVIADAETAKELGQQLSEVESELSAKDPQTEKAADLQNQRLALLEKIGKVAETSKSPSVVLSAAVDQATPQRQGFMTDTGKMLGMSPDQEHAMMISGKGIIAAGAGSGKTRVLAGKVRYAIIEQGVSPSSIIATSFSRKSAAELKKRIEKYTGEGSLDDNAAQGFGTTHSISLKMLTKFSGPQNIMKPSTSSGLIKTAMAQVQMRGYASGPQPDPEESLVPPADLDEDVPGIQESDEDRLIQEYRQAVNKSLDWHYWLREKKGTAGWLNFTIDLLESNANRDPRKLSPKQRASLKKAIARGIGIRKDQLSDYDPPFLKMSSSLEEEYVRTVEAARPRRDSGGKGKKGKNFFKKNPANQWFNLGMPLKDEKGRPYGAKTFQTEISKFKAGLTAPGKAWAERQDMFAAVYGAYEWLKKNDPRVAGQIDFDDMLVKAIGLLRSNAKVRKTMQAQYTHIFVDEAQDLNKCVLGSTEVQTPKGPKLVRDLIPGEDEVLSFDNGRTLFNKVLAKSQSSWDRGVKVTTESGRTMVMSPNHRIYATPVEIPECALYLMYREGFGFRVGVSTRLFRVTSKGSGGRAQAERADCAWVLKRGTVDEMLYEEYAHSLQWGVPTLPYEAEVHGCDQERTGRVFASFGHRGAELLQHYDLSFDHPHWIAQNHTRSRIERKVINLQAHRKRGSANQHGSCVTMNWTGDLLPEMESLGISTYNVGGSKDGTPRRMINQLRASYAEAADIASQIAGATGLRVKEALLFEDEKLPLITASGLFEGMQVPVWHSGFYNGTLPIGEYRELARRLEVDIDHFKDPNQKEQIHQYLRSVQIERGLNPLHVLDEADVRLERVVSVEPVVGGDFWDIEVERSANFYGNGILSHNSQHTLFGLVSGHYDPETLKPREDGSMTAKDYVFIGDDKQAIYEFRGAEPDIFIEQSDAHGGDFETRILDLNYRSGKAIVDAANKLIAHNKKQIPMECKANVARKGMGIIHSVPVPSHEEGAALMASDVQKLLEAERSTFTPADFGVALRTNAEAFAFGVEMLKRGIPFRSKVNFFNDPTTKSLVNWLQIAQADPSNKKEMNMLVLEAHRVPNFFLDKVFNDTVQRRARGKNFFFWLRDGGWQEVYDQEWRNRKNVLGYIEAIEQVQSWGQQGMSPTEILNNVLAMTGAAGDSVMDALVKKIEGSPEAMDLLRTESEDGEVTEEDIKGMAMAPIKPLLGLIDSYEDLGVALDYVGKLQKANTKKGKKDDPGASDYQEAAVVIDTCHGWKGLECKHLYTSMPAGVFPHARSEGDEESLASERRLGYVALTRGEDSVTVLVPEISHIGKPAGTSVFVDEACIPMFGGDVPPEETDEEKGEIKLASFDEADLDAFLKDDFDHFERKYGKRAHIEKLEKNWEV